MVFHMLRWEMGDAVFRQVPAGAGDSSMRIRASVQRMWRRWRRVFEAAADGVLFAVAGWNRGPEYTDNYSVFRLGRRQGISHCRLGVAGS